MPTRNRLPSAADASRLQALQLMLVGNLATVFDALDVSMTRVGRKFTGCCPVHGGDHPQGVNLYHTGESVPGYWKCYTRHCEQTFKKTILGFIRGVLSHKKFDWPKSNKLVPFGDVVAWCCNLLGTKLEDVSIDSEAISLMKFVGEVGHLIKQPARIAGAGLTRAEVRDRIEIPATYFVDRGWSPETLDRYDVGLCADAKRPFYGRAVVPIYDTANKFAVGFTARSTSEQCLHCELWHEPERECPVSDIERQGCSKWRNSKGFARESHLYNFGFAKREIERDAVTVLVEGPGDLWRLEEAGIHCGLAMMGSSLSDQQQVLLEKSGAMTVVIATNMDEAGRTAAMDIKKQLCRAFRVVMPDFPANDLGELRPEAVSEILLPIVEKARR